MIGVVRDELGRCKHEHVEDRAIIVARGLEGGDVSLAHHATLAGYAAKHRGRNRVVRADVLTGSIAA